MLRLHGSGAAPAVRSGLRGKEGGAQAVVTHLTHRMPPYTASTGADPEGGDAMKADDPSDVRLREADDVQ